MRKLPVLALPILFAFGLFLHFHLPKVTSAKADTLAVSPAIFTDSLGNGWSNWSWNSQINFNNISPTHSGSNSIAWTPNSWGGLYLHLNGELNNAQYGNFQFSIYTTNPNLQLGLLFYNSSNQVIGSRLSLSPLGGVPGTNSWKTYTVPLSLLNSSNNQISGIAFQEIAGQNQPAIYLDDLSFVQNSSPTPNIPISFTETAKSNPVTVSAGDPIIITYDATSNQTISGLIDMEVHNSSGAKIFQDFLDNQNFTSGNAKTFTAVWNTSKTTTPGQYTVQVGIFNPSWNGVLSYNANVTHIIVNPAPTPTPTPTTTPTPTPSPSLSPTKISGTTGQTSQSGTVAHFATVPPGSTLPSGDTCKSMIRYSSWEVRPSNNNANNTTGTKLPNPMEGTSAEGNQKITPRIDGNFTGTTDEIIQWGACKWGFDEDDVRAVAAKESWWRQATLGDFNGTNYESYGLMQVRRTAHVGTFPTSQQSTAFDVDYALAWRRACFEGYFTWIPSSAKGDEWGCIGLWFSGNWNDSGAQSYEAAVRDYMNQKIWTTPNFESGDSKNTNY